jgi:ribonuclease P protein component
MAPQTEPSSLTASRQVIHRPGICSPRLTTLCENPCNTALFPPVTGAKNYEAHLPAVQNPSRTYARVSRAYEDPRRTGCYQRAPSQRTGTSGGLKPARLRLPRKARLSGKAHFTGKYAARRQGKFFVVLSRNSPPGGQARLGIVIGRHTAPRSVTRTLMKRAVREVFRQLRNQLGPVDVVVRVRQPAARPELPAARHELERLLRESC